MTPSTKRGAVALGLAGALSLVAAAPSFAAPVLSSTTALTSAAPSNVTDVRWRGNGLAAAGIGLAAGAVVGAAAASAAAPYGYYGDGYYADAGYGYYGAPAYGYGYEAAPAYSYGYDAAYAEPGYPAYGYAPTYNWGGGTRYTYVAPAPAYAAAPAYTTATTTRRTFAAEPVATERRVRTNVRTSRTVTRGTFASDAGANSGQCWIVTGSYNNHGFMGDCKAKGAMPANYRPYWRY